MQGEVAVQSSPALLAALVLLREELERASLKLDLPEVEIARTRRRETVDQLEDYILPRLVQLDAPLLAVVGGSTGAGKSTLVNSIVGHRVSQSGVLRPTTRSPVLVHHPDDAAWFAPDRILPDLARTTSPTHDIGALHLVSTTAMPAGLAVLDAPDVDSVDADNRALAAQLLAAADLWLFVTSAARYADQVPWNFLQAAAERNTAVAVVLDRTAPASLDEVRGHLARMMSSRGLKDSPLFDVPEVEVDEDGLLPAAAVAQVRAWINDLAADANARSAIVARTLSGAVRQTVFRGHDVADAVAEQTKAADRLRTDVTSSYGLATAQAVEATADGTMLRGEVLARWQDFVGTGEFIRSLEERVGRLRDRVVNTLRGRPQLGVEVTEAVEHGLHTLLVHHAENAAEATSRSWASTQSGRVLVDSAPVDLERASPQFRLDSERLVREWQGGVLEMVRAEGADRRATARFLALGVNGVGVALMIVVFSHSAGITGGEVGIAGGTAVIGQKLLEAIFGDQAVRTLAQRAHADLTQRIEALFAQEQQRYLALVDAVAPAPSAQDHLRDAARAVEDARNDGAG